MKNIFSLVRGVLIIIALCLLVGILFQFGVDNFVNIFNGLSVKWLLLSIVFICGNFIFVTLRYRLLVAKNLSFFSVLEVILSGFVLNYASMIQGLGVGIKVGMMKAKKIPVARSFTGILVEMAFDVALAMAYIVGYCFFLGWEYFPLRSLVSLVVCIFTLIFMFFLLKKKFVAVEKKYIAMRNELRGGPIFKLSVYTFFIWSSAGLALYCLILSFPETSAIDILFSFFSMMSGFLVGMVSLVPGGMGAREITMSYIFSQKGLAFESVVVVTVIYRLLFIVVVLFSLLFLSVSEKMIAKMIR